VLGGGNGAHAMATDLSLNGFEVRICEAPEFEATFRTTLEQRGVKLIDAWGKEEFMKTRQNTPPLVAGMNGERGSRGCNPLERGFQGGCRPLWSRAGLYFAWQYEIEGERNGEGISLGKGGVEQ
jgi:hypothetical protein